MYIEWDHEDKTRERLLSQATLRSCTLVCRSWNEAFHRSLYLSVFIARKHQVSTFLRAIRNLRQENLSSIGNLTLDCVESNCVYSVAFAVACRLPNLETFMVVGLDVSSAHPRFARLLHYLPSTCKIYLPNVNSRLPIHLDRFMRNLPSNASYTPEQPPRPPRYADFIAKLRTRMFRISTQCEIFGDCISAVHAGTTSGMEYKKNRLYERAFMEFATAASLIFGRLLDTNYHFPEDALNDKVRLQLEQMCII